MTVYGTDPNRADTDGDGASDAAEISQGFDPLDPLSSPLKQVAPPTVITILPNSAKAGTTVKVVITGTNFAAGAAVTFEGGKGTPPVALGLAVKATTISATVTIKRSRTDRRSGWDVVVTNPDGKRGRLAGGFVVISSGD